MEVQSGSLPGAISCENFRRQRSVSAPWGFCRFRYTAEDTDPDPKPGTRNPTAIVYVAPAAGVLFGTEAAGKTVRDTFFPPERFRGPYGTLQFCETSDMVL